MSINGLVGVTGANYQSYQKEMKKQSKPVSDASNKKEEVAAVYEKSSTEGNVKKSYTINKMSDEERAALVEQLQREQQSRQDSLIKIVKDMMLGQGQTYNNANDIWQFLASGNYTVSEAAKVKAQEDIAEDGYYGVKQTSERLFDFASALAGDDVDKMKEMQKAMEKGYKEATKAWGKELPSICKETIDAANKMFEDYYASKEA